MSAGHVRSVFTSHGVRTWFVKKNLGVTKRNQIEFLMKKAARQDEKILTLSDHVLQIAKMVNEQMILIELLAKNLAETTQRVSKIEEKAWTKRDICTN